MAAPDPTTVIVTTTALNIGGTGGTAFTINQRADGSVDFTDALGRVVHSNQQGGPDKWAQQLLAAIKTAGG